MKQTHYTLIDTLNTHNEDFKLDYQDYVDYCCDEPRSFEDWLVDRLDADFEDFLCNIKYLDLGVATISGSVGCWDGRHEIMPVSCRDLYTAISKCLDNQDYFKVEVWKSKIEVTTYNHDSQYHGPNRFVIRTKKKRDRMWLY